MMIKTFFILFKYDDITCWAATGKIFGAVEFGRPDISSIAILLSRYLLLIM
jgi:hypothetical protein